MNVRELIELFGKGTKRCHLIGGEEAGVVAGLDLEGRLFAVLDGEVLNRVNPEAFLGTTTREEYLNPGGDGLWPAPEGSRLGYEYPTGDWRVPPGLSGARYWVAESGPDQATIRAEIDLINDQALGVPTAFERRIRVRPEASGMTMVVTECIEYLGARKLSREECLLAPWSLAQFDSGPGCEVLFPGVDPACIWDLYDPSDDQRRLEEGVWHTRTDGAKRYQIGLAEAVDWIEYVDPRRGLRARRTAEKLPADLRHIDITDSPPDQDPADRAIRLSVYSDTTGFMEIEAAGGCPAEIAPGAAMPLTVTTTYCRQ